MTTENDTMEEILDVSLAISKHYFSEGIGPIDSDQILKQSDLALRMVSIYQDIFMNLSLKEDYQEVFFKKWPNAKLPEEYQNWVDLKFAHGKNGTAEGLNGWVAKEFSKYKTATEDIKLRLLFGATLLQLAAEARRNIQMFHNRLYVFPAHLESGKSMSSRSGY
jgi:hypothetical protein